MNTNLATKFDAAYGDPDRFALFMAMETLSKGNMGLLRPNFTLKLGVQNSYKDIRAISWLAWATGMTEYNVFRKLTEMEAAKLVTMVFIREDENGDYVCAYRLNPIEDAGIGPFIKTIQTAVFGY